MEFLKRVIALWLTPVIIIIVLIKKTFEVIEPLARSIGDGMIELFNLMYEFWKGVFKWK